MTEVVGNSRDTAEARRVFSGWLLSFAVLSHAVSPGCDLDRMLPDTKVGLGLRPILDSAPQPIPEVASSLRDRPR
jgi:hypothetical protein